MIVVVMRMDRRSSLLPLGLLARSRGAVVCLLLVLYSLMKCKLLPPSPSRQKTRSMRELE